MSGYRSGWPRLFYELGGAAGGQLNLHLESIFPGVRRCGWRLGSFTLSCAAILWDDVPFFASNASSSVYLVCFGKSSQDCCMKPPNKCRSRRWLLVCLFSTMSLLRSAMGRVHRVWPVPLCCQSAGCRVRLPVRIVRLPPRFVPNKGKIISSIH